MRICLLPLLAGTLSAATVRGTVVENITGHALAHASVLMEPVSGSAGKRMTGHTNRYGMFEFAGAVPGLYFLQATRAPFLTAYYGQKRWNSSGTPLTVTDAESPYVTIRMMRYAAISGTVVDENDVGQPLFQVSAYRADTVPLQLAGKGEADEVGNFRIYGLLPGDYLVRSVGKQLEGVGYKPTFAHESESAEQARIMNVEMEQEFRDVKLRALQGKLYSLAVIANPLDPYEAVPTITLASEMGRQIVKGVAHTFTGLPPGDYDVIAEAPSDIRDVLQCGYQRVSLGKDSSVSLSLRKVDLTVQFNGVPQQAVNDGTVKLIGRRHDLAGPRDTQVINLADRHAYLTAGPWDFAIAPIDGYHVSGFNGSARYRTRQRYDGWNELVLMPRPNGNFAWIAFSTGIGALHGMVTQAGEPVVGAPVFLEPLDLEPERRLTDAYIATTDTQGRYRFLGLVPGRYRVLSSFEYQMPDSKIMTEARARDLQIDAHGDVAMDLDLYVIR